MYPEKSGFPIMDIDPRLERLIVKQPRACPLGPLMVEEVVVIFWRVCDAEEGLDVMGCINIGYTVRGISCVQTQTYQYKLKEKRESS
jgi:hypothetical protein